MHLPATLDERLVFALLDRYVGSKPEPDWHQWAEQVIEAHENWCVLEGCLLGSKIEKPIDQVMQIVRYSPHTITDLGRRRHRALVEKH